MQASNQIERSIYTVNYKHKRRFEQTEVKAESVAEAQQVFECWGSAYGFKFVSAVYSHKLMCKY